MNDVQDRVGMVQDEAGGQTVDDKLARFSVTLNAAAHETLIIMSFFKEVKEAIGDVFAFVNVMLDHFVREQACSLVSNDNFFGLEASELLDAFVNIT